MVLKIYLWFLFFIIIIIICVYDQMISICVLTTVWIKQLHDAFVFTPENTK